MLALQPWVQSRPEAERVRRGAPAPSSSSEACRRGAPDPVTGAFHLSALTQGALLPARVRPLGARPRRLDGGRAHRRRAGDDSREPGGRLRRGATASSGRWPPALASAFPGAPVVRGPHRLLRRAARPLLRSGDLAAGHLALARRGAPCRAAEAFRVRERALPVRRWSSPISALRLSVRDPSHWQVLGPLLWAEIERAHVMARRGLGAARRSRSASSGSTAADPLLLEDELARVLRDAVHAHLVVQVRAGGAAGVAHRARPAGRASPGRRPSPRSSPGGRSGS